MPRGDIDSDDVQARVGQDRRRRQTDISKADVYTVNLMRRQMNAATEVQTMIFKNTPKGEWSGWKVKIDYECVDKDGMKYRAERWVFFDREGKDVVKTFEIPLP